MKLNGFRDWVHEEFKLKYFRVSFAVWPQSEKIMRLNVYQI